MAPSIPCPGPSPPFFGRALLAVSLSYNPIAARQVNDVRVYNAMINMYSHSKHKGQYLTPAEAAMAWDMCVVALAALLDLAPAQAKCPQQRHFQCTDRSSAPVPREQVLRYAEPRSRSRRGDLQLSDRAMCADGETRRSESVRRPTIAALLNTSRHAAAVGVTDHH